MIASEHRLALPAGYQLGKYRFKGVLGAGGFGITYLADDQTLGRRVAIKELLPNDIATRVDGATVVAKTKSEQNNLVWARERFLEEGRALAACEHPNVVHVYEMIEANGTAYMVTKYEDGRSLAEWLTNLGRPPTEPELRGILEPLLAGLEKVHRAGFLHRDLKPENIYLTEDGRPLLLDFGSARQAVTDRSTLLTSIVTIGYAPFEQYYEDGKQGPWTDIYSMAGVMYRAIHGEKPPEATRRLKNDSSVKLAKRYQRDYSLQFLNAIDRALAVEYQDRPQSVVDWRGMLGKGVAVPAEQLTLAPQPDWMNRLRMLAGLALAFPRTSASAAGAAVVLVGWAIWSATHPIPIPYHHPGPVAVVTPAPFVKTDPAPTPLPTPAAGTPGSTPGVWQNVFAGGTPVAMPLDQWVKREPAATPAVPAVGGTVDPGLVGHWTAKVGPSAKNYILLHWEQLASGRWTLKGGMSAAGTLNALNGQMHRTTDDSPKIDDLTYEIKEDGSEVVTNDPTDPNGPVTWTRDGSKSGRSKSSSGHSSGGNGDSGAHYNVPDVSRFHLPHGLPAFP